MHATAVGDEPRADGGALLEVAAGNRAIFQKLIKRMRRVDESWERQTAPRIYIHSELC